MAAADKYRLNTLNTVLCILTIVGLCWTWTASPFFKDYTYQLIALLVLFYLVYHLFFERKLSRNLALILEIKTIFMTAIVLLFVSITGGLESDFFFLIYFLNIAVAVLLNPLIAFFLNIFSILYFAPNLATGDQSASLIRLGSILAIVPLTTFFAHGYLRVIEQDEKITSLDKDQKIYINELEKIRHNIKLWTALHLKGQLSTVKHYLHVVLNDKKTKLDQKHHSKLEKVYISNQKALDYIETFERMAGEEIDELEAEIEKEQFKKDVKLDL